MHKIRMYDVFKFSFLILFIASIVIIILAEPIVIMKNFS